MASRYSEAQNKATKKYQSKVYDNYRLRFPKGYKDEILKIAVEESGQSLHEYIITAVMQRLKSDRPDLPTISEWKGSQIDSDP